MKKILILFTLFFWPIFSTPAFAFTREQIINLYLDAMNFAPASPKTVYADTPVWDIRLRQVEAELANEPWQNQPKNRYALERELAIETEMRKAGLYISLNFDYNYIHYSEWEGDRKLDEDFGGQSGGYYKVGYRHPESINISDWIMGKPYIEGYYREYANDIHYKGAIIGGGPYNAMQRSEVRQFGVRFGGYGTFATKGEVIGFIDIGKRVWDRAEDALPQYHEKYYWNYIGLGTGIDYRFLPKLSIGTEAEILFANNPRMRVDMFDTTFQLGTVWGAELSLPIKYYLFKNLSLDLTPYFTYWDIEASNSEFVELLDDFIYEPDSKTNLQGLLFGVTYTF